MNKSKKEHYTGRLFIVLVRDEQTNMLSFSSALTSALSISHPLYSFTFILLPLNTLLPLLHAPPIHQTNQTTLAPALVDPPTFYSEKSIDHFEAQHKTRPAIYYDTTSLTYVNKIEFFYSVHHSKTILIS